MHVSYWGQNYWSDVYWNESYWGWFPYIVSSFSRSKITNVARVGEPVITKSKDPGVPKIVESRSIS